MVDVQGQVDEGFGAVADAFAGNFSEYGEVGAAFCLHVDGRKVVDIWAGVADPASGRPYDDSTLQLVFSTTKGATAICAHVLADRGELDYDAPVARYWPEFAANGKGDIPVRWILSHQAGLPSVDKRLSLDEILQVRPIVEALAEQAPLWEPGTAHGYHGLTYGWLVGELVRRVSGKTLGRFLADEVSGPLGLEFWIGLPEEYEPRVAPVLPGAPLTDPELRAVMRAVIGPGTIGWRALTVEGAFHFVDIDSDEVVSPEQVPFNWRRVHASEIGAANGITNARSLSRLYAATIGPVDGVRLFGDATMNAARQSQSFGPDKCLMVESKFGLGFMLDSQLAPLLGPGSFGHPGAGGSLGYADPESGVAYGYVMNQMGAGIAGDPRTITLNEAVRASLG